MFYQLTSSTTVLQITIILLSVGMLITTFEYLFNYKLFTSEGLLDWKIIRIRWKNGLLKTFLNFIVRNNLFNLILISRVFLIVALLAAPAFSLVSWVAMIAIFFTYAITTLLTFYGSDGSDQMTNIIIISICLCFAPFTNEHLVLIGISFIAIQSCLSYFVAGFSKLLSKEWRSGSAVRDIFRTRTYGSERIYNYIRDKNVINLLLCWSVIVAEMSFPLILILPLEWGVGLLIWGFTFHLLNSFIMGLNTFLWAFLATYPSIIYINLYLAN